MTTDTTDRKSVNTGRTARGRFAAGNPGKPRGARHRTTQAVEALLDGEAETLTRKAIELAKAGDTVALRMVMDRITPPRKDRAVVFDLPDIATAADAFKAMPTILKAAAAGELTPSEAGEWSRLIESYVRLAEVQDLAERVANLEGRQPHGSVSR